MIPLYFLKIIFAKAKKIHILYLCNIFSFFFVSAKTFKSILLFLFIETRADSTNCSLSVLEHVNCAFLIENSKGRVHLKIKLTLLQTNRIRLNKLLILKWLVNFSNSFLWLVIHFFIQYRVLIVCNRRKTF